MSSRIDGKMTNTETPVVFFRRKYLIFAPNVLSELNVGFGFKIVKSQRVRKTVAIMSAWFDGRTTNTETAIVPFRRKYLVFVPNFLSDNGVFDFKLVRPKRVRYR